MLPSRTATTTTACATFSTGPGLETADEAQAAFQQGQRDAKAGRLPEAVIALRRAVHLDPSRPAHFETLAAVLRRTGEADGAAEVLTRAQVYHPAPQGLVREQAAPPQSSVLLSTTALNFGTLRQGQSRAPAGDGSERRWGHAGRPRGFCARLGARRAACVFDAPPPNPDPDGPDRRRVGDADHL